MQNRKKQGLMKYDLGCDLSVYPTRWPFLHVFILQEMLFSTLLLGSAPTSSFRGYMLLESSNPFQQSDDRRQQSAYKKDYTYVCPISCHMHPTFHMALKMF